MLGAASPETRGVQPETDERSSRRLVKLSPEKGGEVQPLVKLREVAGVNEATLFRHFKSKEALLIAVAQRYCGAVQLRSALEELPGTLEEDLFTLGGTMLAHMEAVRDMMRWSLVEEDVDESVFSSTTWRPQKAVHEAFTEYLQRRVASGELQGDPKKLALVFMSFLFSHVMARKKFDLEQMYGSSDIALRYYIEVFLNGVRSAT